MNLPLVPLAATVIHKEHLTVQSSAGFRVCDTVTPCLPGMTTADLYHKHFHHLITKVIDDLDRKAACCGAGEWAGGVAVER